MEKIKVKIEWSGDNFVAATGEVNGLVIVTHKNPEKLKKEFESAFQFHVEGSLKDGDELPEFVKSGNYEFDYELQVSAMLKELDGVITRKALSRVMEMNERQLGHYLQGRKKARPETRRRLVEGLDKINQKILSVV